MVIVRNLAFTALALLGIVSMSMIVSGTTGSNTLITAAHADDDDDDDGVRRRPARVPQSRPAPLATKPYYGRSYRDDDDDGDSVGRRSRSKPSLQKNDDDD